MAVVAVAVGFAAQGLAPRPYGAAQGELLDALIDTPPPAQDTTTAAEQLRRLEARRATPQATATATASLGLDEPEAGPGVDLEIRVALLGAGTNPDLSASGAWQVVSRDGQLLQQGGAGSSVNLNELWLQGPEAWLQTSGTSVLVNGRPYGGRLRLIPESGGLRVVNHVGLENYIGAVVGAEMPSSWSLEALRAQAVAARSYALAHMARPANRHWHLGDTTRWQAYKGLSSSNERTRQAAASTAGMILSYQGAIVESLYAANRQISLEAHGHLGASMSQHGAQDLAMQGYRYNQILGHYYQGASLARLKAGAS
ncbi:SpoIID/LytB domain-containing protein [Cyanobium sp. BA5m-21]|nr:MULTISPECIES: SpoIID/LytB domain-containing protein [unclassified Cyanobium]MCP9903026.1 SpoIID/LytB domain-containing protein [Cyanobium sp. BA5m-10]MCP9905612.1 SpoIID/LytB domain-containing protein [Cyanobium sp. BA5m-21]MCP9913630.1 SpoIID/LytB domain-containing protein [Cyanobium sp. BA20m-14]